ncbi:MAG: DegT/DnrJ/EryC1/StrS family aminotransferase [bacterium]|nr:DegT/DnrJ/EryC1/StrS family aminotransferase [bacterium]
MIPHSRPSLGPEEEEAACRVIRSGMLAQGREVAAFEEDLGKLLNADFVVALSSGSAALHLTLLALGIQSGDGVIMPAYVCTALLHAAAHVQAQPLLADITPQTLNIAPESVQRLLDQNARAILVPHMFGQSADLDALSQLGLPIVEDCAMALGATRHQKYLGTLGEIGIFSFYATKVLCAGEGGAIATSNAALADRVRDLREYDGRKDARPRFNYKMTDLQAAIARVQLQKLKGFVQKRRKMGQQYDLVLKHTSAQIPEFSEGSFPFRYVIRHEKGAHTLVNEFEARGVAARQPVFYPLHKCLNQPPTHLSQTELVYQEALSLPLYPALTESETHHILQVAQDLL